MSNVLSGCHDAREMKEIRELTCPKCHAVDGIEIISKDGVTIGDSICDVCGYVIEEGTLLNHVDGLKETDQDGKQSI